MYTSKDSQFEGHNLSQIVNHRDISIPWAAQMYNSDVWAFTLNYPYLKKNGCSTFSLGQLGKKNTPRKLAPFLEQFILVSVFFFNLRYRASIFKIQLRKLSQIPTLRLCVTLITHFRSPSPHLKPSVSTRDSFLFFLSILLSIMFPAHNQKLMVHFYSSCQQREPQANFHSCFLPIFPLLTLLIIALCQPLLYVNYNWTFFKKLKK